MATTEIVVVGGGIAGVPTAYQIKDELGEEAQVTVVSERPRFHFIPSNPWLALGWRHAEEISFDLAPLLDARGIDLQTQALQSVTPDRKQITLGDGSTLRYDYLILATGIRPLWNAVSGAEADPRVQSVILPEEVTRAYQGYREYLRKPGPIVIAAAPGASILGPMYEYVFLLDADLRRRGVRARVPITLITPEPYPGHLGLDRPVAREALEQALQAHDIEWIGDARLEEAGDGQVRFAGGGQADPPQTRPFEYAVVWPPFGGTEAARDLPWSNKKGFISVDDRLRAGHEQSVFALGACTAKELLTDTRVPVGVPDAVYPIQQQAAVVARNVVHGVRGQPLVDAQIERARWIADMGERGAAYLTAPHLPLRDINWLRRGRWVFEAKRDFEHYFIHQVLFGAGEHAHVTALVRGLSSQAGPTSATSERLQEGSVSCGDDLRRRLESLAAELGISADELGQKLLEAAIAEAHACLDGNTRDRVEARIRERLINEIDAERERVRFEGGAP